MQFQEVKDLILAQPGFDRTLLSASRPPRWGLVVATAPRPVSFDFIKAGTNKLIFRIVDTEWVICIQNNERTKTEIAKLDFEGEVKALAELGKQDIRVPHPFMATDGVLPQDTMFQIQVHNEDSGIDARVYAIIMEFLDFANVYKEMDKQEPQEAFIKSCLSLPSAGEHVQATRDSFQLIKRAWEQKPWNDFQVAYNILDGTLLVFDPMAGQVVNKEKVDRILQKWSEDL